MKGWVLVTGAAKGLGEEICKTLAKSGLSVIIHYNKSREKAEILQKYCEDVGVDTFLIQGNFSQQNTVNEFIRRLFEAKLPIRYLVNNVGNYLTKSLLETSEEEWSELFNVNVNAPLMLCKLLSDSIIKQKGAIINLGVAGLDTRKADTYSPAYMTTKQSLLCITKSLAKELANHRVSVNMISPGHMSNSIDKPNEIDKIPMKRVIEFSEVAETIKFLFSDMGKNITGQNIEISGGVRL